MKRHKSTVLSVLLIVLLMGAAAQAQGVIQTPQDQRLQEMLDSLQRSFQARGPVQGGGRRGAVLPSVQPGGAWWTNTALVARLGLTDDQKAKIERAFENRRQQIMSSTELLEKEEAQLARLLEGDPIDRNAVLTQIDRVIQARGEMERANSAMTLEMREYLTRAQWMQLQSPFQLQSPAQRARVGGNVIAANLISQVEPVYPELARQARIQGVVVLEAEISREGTVENLKVVTGHPLLTQAALDAVKQWRYKPIMLNGQPVPVVTTITVNFAFSAGGPRVNPFGERGAAPTPPSGPGQRRGQQ